MNTRDDATVAAWRLPWGEESVPHGVLDIIRGCNISCRACYNRHPARVKPLAEIEGELDVLLGRRRLQSVSIVGGEVLLHPDIFAVIRSVKRRNLCVEMFTNAVLLDNETAARLRASGLDLIFLHVEAGQRRPDLPRDAGSEDVRRLREEKAALAARNGLDVALAITAHDDRLGEVREAVEFVVASPHVNYLLATLYRDHANYAAVSGNLRSGLRGRLVDPARKRTDVLTNARLLQILWDEFHFRPFAFLGSNQCDGDPRWLSFMVATGRSRDGRMHRLSVKPSRFEPMYLAASRILTGRYPMFRRQRSSQVIGHLALNGMMGGDFEGNFHFLSACRRSGAALSVKRLLFQCPAELADDGRLIHCRHCPDAVVRNNELVPVCIADKVIN